MNNMTSENQLRKDFAELEKYYYKIKKCRTKNREDEGKKQRALNKISGEIERIKEALALKKKISKSTTDQRAELLGAFWGEFKKTREFVDEVKDYSSDKGLWKREAGNGFQGSVEIIGNEERSLAVKTRNTTKRKSTLKEKIKKVVSDPRVGVNFARYKIKSTRHKINNAYKKMSQNTSYEEYMLYIKIHQSLRQNTPAIFDYDSEKRKIYMEPIDGVVLRKNLKKIEKNLTLIAELGKIIATMHNRDFIHGDLKDENIMLDKNNIWKIIDFGGAKEIIPNSKEKVEYQKNDIFRATENLSKKATSRLIQSYLLNRDLKKTFSCVLNERKVDYPAMDAWLDYVVYLAKKLYEPREEILDYVRDIIGTFDSNAKAMHSGDENLRKLIENYKSKISKSGDIGIASDFIPTGASTLFEEEESKNQESLIKKKAKEVENLLNQREILMNSIKKDEEELELLK